MLINWLRQKGLKILIFVTFPQTDDLTGFNQNFKFNPVRQLFKYDIKRT